MARTFNRWIPLLILLVGIATLGTSVFLFIRLDRVVNVDLYDHGLQFDYEWAVQYWFNLRLALALVGVAIFANCLGVAYIFLRPGTASHTVTVSRRQKGAGPKLSAVFLTAGAISLVSSILYSSTILLYAGLSLALWGGILIIIKDDRYVKEALLDKTMFSSLETLDQIIADLGVVGQGIYLPPKYLMGFDSTKVFVGRQEDTRLPAPDHFPGGRKGLFIRDSDGIYIEPPGARMAEYFEKILGTSFSNIDLKRFPEKISKILLENLELAGAVEINNLEGKLKVKLENSAFAISCANTQSLRRISGSLGCPFCSAIACALAEVTGKLVAIEKEEASRDRRSIIVEYRLLTARGRE